MVADSESRVTETNRGPALTRGQRVFVGLLAAWALLTVSFVTLAVWRNRVMRAVLLMGDGLVLFWIFLGGALMYAFRDSIRAFVLRIRLDWRVKFVLFATLLALLEEAVTTTMTNLAPLFGVRIGQAYITASSNYFDVVLLHSVIVFIPMFMGWALVLSRYDFTPFEVFLLFGISGVLAEFGFGGPQALAELAMWIFVYGLMIYLPAYSLPANRGARRPPWWLYPFAAAVLPYLSLIVFFVVPLLPHLFVGFHHPRIDFPPIKP